ncbi:MAG TPA: glycosyltransferase [Acidimicrobiales bacterium]|nr:glycosyltransferase [Acidimicrobiales bacterium]
MTLGTHDPAARLGSGAPPASTGPTGASSPERELPAARRLVASFVVIAFNEALGIEACLRSIEAQADLGAHEIVVVDDGSTDLSAVVLSGLRAELAHLRVVELGRNRGRGAARAAGIRAAIGPLIAMVDADVVLPQDWWRRCRQALERCDVASGIAVPDGDVAYLARRFGLAAKPVDHTTPTPGSNAVFRRTVFDKVAYDADLREGEDVALDHQMAAAGVPRRVLRDLIVDHRERKSLAETLAWLFRSGIGASRQLERYRRVRGPDRAFALVTVVFAAAGLPCRRARRARLAASGTVLIGVAGAHVRAKFVFRRRDAGRYLAAVVTDAGLLSAYFAGRLVGHARLRQGRGAS